MAKLRIAGVVRAMNRARAQLASGIAASDVPAFSALVRDTVRFVDDACRTHHTHPTALPTPSYRAYMYLKALDLDRLPVVPDGTRQASSPRRIRGLVAATNTLHTALATLTRTGEPVSETHPQLAALRTHISQHLHEVEAWFAGNNSTAADLPMPSRRAYQWLTHLADRDTLHAHLNTLAVLQRIAHAVRNSKHTANAARGAQLQPSLYHSSYLYRATLKAGRLHLTAHEGFAAAPDDVLAALVRVCYHGKRDKSSAAVVRQFSLSDDYAEVIAALESTGLSQTGQPIGQHIDLVTVFARVNTRYFDGNMPMPRLIWSNRHTRRKLGHYQALTDTVMISMTLDDPRVPDFAIDFVMYHELLHKQLGTEVVNGRRHAHTPAFRKAEHRFVDYEKAEAFLQQHAAG